MGPYFSQSGANFYNDLINDNHTEKIDTDSENQEMVSDNLTDSHEPEKEKGT